MFGSGSICPSHLEVFPEFNAFFSVLAIFLQSSIAQEQQISIVIDILMLNAFKLMIKLLVHLRFLTATIPYFVAFKKLTYLKNELEPEKTRGQFNDHLD